VEGSPTHPPPPPPLPSPAAAAVFAVEPSPSSSPISLPPVSCSKAIPPQGRRESGEAKRGTGGGWVGRRRRRGHFLRAQTLEIYRRQRRCRGRNDGCVAVAVWLLSPNSPRGLAISLARGAQSSPQTTRESATVRGAVIVL